MKPKFKVNSRVLIKKEVENTKPAYAYTFSIKESHIVKYWYKGKSKTRIEYILRPYNEIYNESDLMPWVSK